MAFFFFAAERSVAVSSAFLAFLAFFFFAAETSVAISSAFFAFFLAFFLAAERSVTAVSSAFLAFFFAFFLAAEKSSLFATPGVAWAASTGDSVVVPMKPIAAMTAINLRMWCFLMGGSVILGESVRVRLASRDGLSHADSFADFRSASK